MWLRRLFGLDKPAPEPQGPALRDLRQRVEALEDEVAHLGTRLVKLRGRVTGGIRRPQDDGEADAPSSENGKSPEGEADMLVPRTIRMF